MASRILAAASILAVPTSGFVPALRHATCRPFPRPASPAPTASPAGAPSRAVARQGQVREGEEVTTRAAPQSPPSEDALSETDESGVAEVYKKALISLTFVALTAAAFDCGVFYFKGGESALDFVSGFLVEESLSVDNLFVFLLLFDYFKVPASAQERVLKWGIFGAVVLRGLFIGLGAVALANFKPILLVFAGILLWSSGKLLLAGEEEEEDLSENSIVKLSSSMLDTTKEYDGDKFFTQVQEKGGSFVKKATPLLLVLTCIELSDIVFAVDSVPAVFGVTTDPFIVFSSNIFAILGLRSVYAVLAEAIENLPYLQPAVAIILGFVGAKIGAEYFGFEIENLVSLAVIISLLAGGVGASYLFPQDDEEES